MGILPSKEFYQGYIGAQSDLTQVMTLNKKLKAQPLRLIGLTEKVLFSE